MRNTPYVVMPILGWLFVATMNLLAAAADPLPSWNEGTSKQAIVAFVEKVTKEGSPDFVPCRSGSPRSTTTARYGASSRCTFR